MFPRAFFRRLGLVCCVAGLVSLAAGRAEAQLFEVVDNEPDFIAFGAGIFDVIDRGNTTAQFNFEYRSNRRLWIFKPYGGLMTSTKGAVYGYAGLRLDLFFGRRWVLTPSTAFGAFEKGSGKDLGSALEFRSGIEIAYRLDDRSRIGAGLFHLSNAGVGNRNPGEEAVVLYYAIPVDWFARHR